MKFYAFDDAREDDHSVIWIEYLCDRTDDLPAVRSKSWWSVLLLRKVVVYSFPTGSKANVAGQKQCVNKDTPLCPSHLRVSHTWSSLLSLPPVLICLTSLWSQVAPQPP